MKDLYSYAADFIVLFHLCYVLFAVGGELLILLGGLFRWVWIRNLTFRIVHLLAVVVVAVEALIGVLCPLTDWEYRLRLRAGQGIEEEIPFMARLVISPIIEAISPALVPRLKIVPRVAITTSRAGNEAMTAIPIFQSQPRG